MKRISVVMLGIASCHLPYQAFLATLSVMFDKQLRKNMFCYKMEM